MFFGCDPVWAHIVYFVCDDISDIKSVMLLHMTDFLQQN